MARGQRTPEPSIEDAAWAHDLLDSGLSRREVSERTGLTQYQIWRLTAPQVNEDERRKNIRRLARNGWEPAEIALILEYPVSFVNSELLRHPVVVRAEEIETEIEDEMARILMREPF